MAASLHVATYTPRETGRMLRAMRRNWRRLEAKPGLGAARLLLTVALDPVLGGTPTPTRWALLCGWESAEARDDFLNGAAAMPFVAGARESWQVSLETVRVTRGEGFHGWRPATEGVAPFAPDEPMLAMTHVRLTSARYMPAFQLRSRMIVREMLASPGLVTMFGAIDHPMIRATLSLWRTKGDTVRFAYGDGLHNPAQKHAVAVPWIKQSFFARFRPLASAGTIDGRDPIADLRAD